MNYMSRLCTLDIILIQNVIPEDKAATFMPCRALPLLLLFDHVVETKLKGVDYFSSIKLGKYFFEQDLRKYINSKNLALDLTCVHQEL